MRCGLELFGAIAVSGIASLAMAESVPPPRSLGCFEIEELKPDYTAPELAGAVRSCVEQARHGDGMALFIAQNSYALFDQQRVRDGTSHILLGEMNGWIFSGMGRDDIDVLRRWAEKFRDVGGDYHRRICEALWAVGPPSYRPSYLIVKGEMPRRNENDWQTKNFDPRVAWNRAVGDENSCSKSEA